MKTMMLLLLGLLAGLLTSAAAQPTTPVTPDVPANVVGWLTMLLPVLVPVLIAGAKYLVPLMPGWWLPILAPLLGAGLDILGYYTAGTISNPLWSAVAGALGVFVRELYDQSKKRLTGG
jgi:hypothetical protein